MFSWVVQRASENKWLDTQKILSRHLWWNDLKFTFKNFLQILLQDIQIDIQNNQGLSKGYQPQSLASADNPYFDHDFDYSGYHKNLIQELFIV